MADEPDDEIDDDDDLPLFGEVWSALIEGSHEDKVRPVVVMFTAEDFAEVVYGGSKPHPKKLHIAVKADHWKGKKMGLTKDTHFWRSAVALVRLDHFKEYLGECPTGLFNELTQFAVEYNDRNPPDSGQARDESHDTE